jgi:hypothetical protein
MQVNNTFSVRVLRLQRLVRQAWYLTLKTSSVVPPPKAAASAVPSLTGAPRRRLPSRVARHFRLCQLLDAAEREDRMMHACGCDGRRAA